MAKYSVRFSLEVQVEAEQFDKAIIEAEKTILNGDFSIIDIVFMDIELQEN